MLVNRRYSRGGMGEGSLVFSPRTKGLSGQVVTIPSSYYQTNGAPLAWGGQTIYGTNGWGVSIPKGASKLLPPYNGLIDLITGNCPAVAGQDGTSVDAVASFFNISPTDLSAMTGYATSIGMSCGQIAAPGVMTQTQVQQAVAANPIPTPIPTFVNTDIQQANASVTSPVTFAVSNGPSPVITSTVNSATPGVNNVGTPAGSTPMMTSSNGAITNGETDWTPWLIGGAAVIGLFLMMGNH